MGEEDEHHDHVHVAPKVEDGRIRIYSEGELIAEASHQTGDTIWYRPINLNTEEVGDRG